MASILNVDQINNAAGTSAVTIDPSTGKPSFPNGATLPAGSVLQVLQVSQAGAQTISSAFTFTNIAGLTLDITPSAATSKILVQWSVNYYVSATYGITIVPIRDDTTRFYYNNVSRPYENYVGAGGMHGRISNQFLDSPATTSTTNYKMQFAVSNTSSSQVGTDSFPMTLTLMEIAQ